MTDSILWKRRQFLGRGLAGLGTLLLSGCYDLSQKPWFTGILGEVENLTHSAQHLFAGPHTLAPEYAKSDIAPVFRANGTLDPDTPDYKAHAGGRGEDDSAGAWPNLQRRSFARRIQPT